ncbi:hypothetical protein EVA_17250 [gut metagenome]|uniref:Uncharacterized protein n=1 Tax=gut metagenome TaxID=749906 RepID=J9G570_9ZZZZ
MTSQNDFSDACDISIMTPCRFISFTTCSPNGLKPFHSLLLLDEESQISLLYE